MEQQYKQQLQNNMDQQYNQIPSSIHAENDSLDEVSRNVKQYTTTTNSGVHKDINMAFTHNVSDHIQLANQPSLRHHSLNNSRIITGLSNPKNGRIRNLHSATVRKTNSPKKKRTSNEIELLSRVRVNRNAYRPYSANH